MKRGFGFFILLFVCFLDYMGIGLVFPLFVRLFFDPGASILATGTSDAVRGLWMGIAIALTPLVQFFISPLWGDLSDQKGRKPILSFGLGIGFVAYALAILGAGVKSLALLLIFRTLLGFCTGTVSVVQAAFVDLSTPQTKARNFGYYNMAQGIGFALGPFIGGALMEMGWGMMGPFALGASLTLLNLLLLTFFFRETRDGKDGGKADLFRGIRQIRQAIGHPTLKFIFIAYFLYIFGWDYFVEFFPVYLHQIHSFTGPQMGFVFAYIAAMYALTVGVLIRPFVNRFQQRTLLKTAMVFGGISLFIILLVEWGLPMWLMLAPICLAMGLFYPVAATFVSDQADGDNQGQLLGVYQSVQALALIVAPLFSGSITGSYPRMPMLAGGTVMLLGAGVLFIAAKQTQSVDERE